MADLGLPSLQILQSAEQIKLLNAVDNLRACGLSDIIDLPQLVVCGDQSSGKSSVLEAISGLPFPKQETLCTRFATEVILRRAPKDIIKVSIFPSEDRTQSGKDELKKFDHELRTKDDFKGAFENAIEKMGLSTSGRSFSKDVLRIEFSGPSQPQLTLVDLPGLIHAESTSPPVGDVELVHDLVSKYLKYPRTIILAVVSAHNDFNNQIIITKARDADPNGSRTLGIITKPDLAKGVQKQESFISLARNEIIKFSLGWHVVKNLDSTDTQHHSNDRDQQEVLFFQESIFNRLPAHTVGIKFLRTRLSRILFENIGTELPKLVLEIQTKISALKLERDKLGPSRTELDQQRLFLISLGQSFQTICRDAVRGDYEHDFFQLDSNPERRLCANVMNMHFSFASNIRETGAKWLINDEHVNNDRYRSRDQAIKEAYILLKRSRGRELPGLPNHLLVGELFRQYSQPWGMLARKHIKNVWEMTNRFLELLLHYLTNEEVCESVLRHWIYPLMEKKLNLAYSKLEELLEVHKDYPMTTNSHFISNSKRSRQEAKKARLSFMTKSGSAEGEHRIEEDVSRLWSSLSTTTDADMVAAEEAFDNMSAYYEVALNLFTDNVPTLAVQGPIIRQVPEIFCPTAVFSMEAIVVRQIAGETEETIEERKSILSRLKSLEEGADICMPYANHQHHVPNLSSDEMNISELPMNASQTAEKAADKLSGKQPIIEFFPDSLSKEGTTKNIFGHLSRSPQTGHLSPDDGKVSASDLKGNSPSPKAASAGLFKVGGATTSMSADTGTQSTKTLFGGLSDSTVFNPMGAMRSPSPTGPRAEGAGRKTGGVLFGQKPLPGFGAVPSTDPPAFAKPSPGEAASTKPATSMSGVDLATGTAFGATASKSSNPSPGQFNGIPLAKNDNSLKFPKNTTPITTVKTTFMVPFEPFVEAEPNTVTEQKNTFLHICFMPQFKKFSCEELRLRDYELLKL